MNTSLVSRLCQAVVGATAVPWLASAQVTAVQRSGDSSIVASTYAAIRIIYDSSGGQVTRSTADNPLSLDDAGPTDVEGRFLAGRVARIVASASNAVGKYSAEFYLRHDSLLFSYETFEFAPGRAPSTQWRNFKKVPAWERRVFWRGETAEFVEASGRSAQLSAKDTTTLLESAQRLRRLVEGSRQARIRPTSSRCHFPYHNPGLRQAYLTVGLNADSRWRNASTSVKNSAGASSHGSCPDPGSTTRRLIGRTSSRSVVSKSVP